MKLTNLVKYNDLVLTNLVNKLIEVITISYESFENLDENKKITIINAGFKVFAEHGYAKASIDDIVKTAGISKGSLFYYFESKKNFLNYLYEYCAARMEGIVDSPGTDGKPSYMAYTDFFERLYAIQLLKMKATTEYPHMSMFMKRIVFDSSPVVKELLSSFNTKYIQEHAMLFFQGLDYSKFKEGIDPMMIIQLLTWCSEGLLTQVLQEQSSKNSNSQVPDFDIVVERYHKYVELLRCNFYKEEFVPHSST